MWPISEQGERGEVGPAGSPGFAGPPVSPHMFTTCNWLFYDTDIGPTECPSLPRRVLTVSLVQEERKDRLEERETLVLLALLDLPDSLDLLLVPLGLDGKTIRQLVLKWPCWCGSVLSVAVGCCWPCWTCWCPWRQWSRCEYTVQILAAHTEVTLLLKQHLTTRNSNEW